MPDEKEKTIEDVSVSAEAQTEAAEDDLSDTDLESTGGASGFINCFCVSSIIVP